MVALEGLSARPERDPRLRPRHGMRQWRALADVNVELHRRPNTRPGLERRLTRTVRRGPQRAESGHSKSANEMSVDLSYMKEAGSARPGGSRQPRRTPSMGRERAAGRTQR